MVGEAEVVVYEVLGEYLRIYSKAGIMSTIGRIQNFLLTPFNVAPLPYFFSKLPPQTPAIFSAQDLQLPFTMLLSNRKKPIRFIKHLPHLGQ